MSFWTLPDLSIVEEDIVEWAEANIIIPNDNPLPGKLTLFPLPTRTPKNFHAARLLPGNPRLVYSIRENFDVPMPYRLRYS